jgi:hypothetical protein
MNWFTIVFKLFGTLVDLAKIAEQLFDDQPDTGEQKKQFVMDAVKALVQGMTGIVFTEELWAKIEKACSMVIDTVCVFMFDSKKKAV